MSTYLCNTGSCHALAAGDDYTGSVCLEHGTHESFRLYTHAEALAMGRAARADGLTVDDCPFEAGSGRAACWCSAFVRREAA